MGLASPKAGCVYFSSFARNKSSFCSLSSTTLSSQGVMLPSSSTKMEEDIRGITMVATTTTTTMVMVAIPTP
jgi:hypothetical protein